MVHYSFDVKELVKEKRMCQNDIDSIKEWSIQEESIPNLNDQQVAIFLIACNNDIETVKKCLVQYYFVRQNAPEIFNNRDMNREEIILQLKCSQFCIIPKRTEQNYAILINKLSDPTPSKYEMDVAMKLLFMTYDAVLYSSPPDGIILIFDMHNTTLRHITRTKIHILKVVTQYVQECVPIKIKEIHIMNTLWFFNKFITFIKPFINKDLISKIHPHLPNDLDEFYENSVPKSHLPLDYGGILQTIDELHEDTCKTLSMLNEHFLEEENERNEYYSNKIN